MCGCVYIDPASYRLQEWSFTTLNSVQLDNIVLGSRIREGGRDEEGGMRRKGRGVDKEGELGVNNNQGVKIYLLFNRKKSTLTAT